MNDVDIGKVCEAGKCQCVTWHYVMDIHEPESVWYSLLEAMK